MPPVAALQMVIDCHYQRGLCRQEGGDEQPQENLAHTERRPDRPVEDAMVGREMPVVLQANRPQGSGHGPTTGGQQSAREEDEGMLEGGTREGRGKGSEQV